MGAVADGTLQGGGRVIGVLPRFLRTKEVAHERLTELVLVYTMHERRLKMHELSDGVIALPGGYGTLEELFEMLPWVQLGLHAKPVGLLNTDGFYDHLQALVDNMARRGFLKEENLRMLLTATMGKTSWCRCGNTDHPRLPSGLRRSKRRKAPHFSGKGNIFYKLAAIPRTGFPGATPLRYGYFSLFAPAAAPVASAPARLPAPGARWQRTHRLRPGGWRRGW
jgi:uncharacterized protein (TIGR00730 family)